MKQDIKVLGIDLAKEVFQLHGTDERGNQVITKRLSRKKLMEFMVKTRACLVGIEACGGAHYWSRLFEKYGHTVKIMSPQFVKPYVKSNKNDARDAEAIAEAVTRPTMRFVPKKTIEQQDILMLHRAREQSMKQRIAQGNQIRGLLLEYGVIVEKGCRHLKKLPEILESEQDKLSVAGIEIFLRLYEQYKTFETEIEYYERKIQEHAATDSRCISIQEIEGIGPLTASAMVASIGDAHAFGSGREVSAWLGLVPRQNSSGNRTVLGGISKRGNVYLRKLLIHGARSVVNTCGTKTDRRSLWIAERKCRSGHNRAAVALANKNARIIWALLTTGECYRKELPGIAA